MESIIVGIDVSKDCLGIAVLPLGEAFAAERKREGAGGAGGPVQGHGSPSHRPRSHGRVRDRGEGGAGVNAPDVSRPNVKRMAKFLKEYHLLGHEDRARALRDFSRPR
jgi:hypothetical protein